MRDFIGVDELWGGIRPKLNEIAAIGPAAWSAYRDFSDLPDGKVMDGGGGNLDMLGNRFLVAGDDTTTLFQVTGGIAWMGGRSRVATGNGYMALRPTPIRLLWGEFVLARPDASVTNAYSSSLAMVITNDETLSLSNLLHPYITRLGWTLQLRQDGGTLNTIASGTWQTPLADDGVTRYEFGFLVYPDTAEIILLWPGIDAATGLDHRVVGNSTFPRCMGVLAYWQENRTDATKVKPGLTRIGLVAQRDASRVQYLTATATLTNTFNIHMVRPAASGVVLTLSAANYANGHVKTISVPSTASYSITVSGNFWDGTTSKTVAAGSTLRVCADTGNNVWAVL